MQKEIAQKLLAHYLIVSKKIPNIKTSKDLWYLLFNKNCIHGLCYCAENEFRDVGFAHQFAGKYIYPTPSDRYNLHLESKIHTDADIMFLMIEAFNYRIDYLKNILK